MKYQRKKLIIFVLKLLQALCQWIAPHMVTGQLSVEKKLLASLWLLANRESYRGVADRFGVNRGTLHKITMRVYKILTCLRGKLALKKFNVLI